MENEKEISKLELEIADIEDQRKNFERKVQRTSQGYFVSILVLLINTFII